MPWLNEKYKKYKIKCKRKKKRKENENEMKMKMRFPLRSGKLRIYIVKPISILSLFSFPIYCIHFIDFIYKNAVAAPKFKKKKGGQKHSWFDN